MRSSRRRRDAGNGAAVRRDRAHRRHHRRPRPSPGRNQSARHGMSGGGLGRVRRSGRALRRGRPARAQLWRDACAVTWPTRPTAHSTPSAPTRCSSATRSPATPTRPDITGIRAIAAGGTRSSVRAGRWTPIATTSCARTCSGLRRDDGAATIDPEAAGVRAAVPAAERARPRCRAPRALGAPADRAPARRDRRIARGNAGIAVALDEPAEIERGVLVCAAPV